MNETDSVFAKVGSLVEVPYVEPSFFVSLDVKSMIPRSPGIWTNDMKNVMCYMQYVMCYMQYVMCYVQDVMCCVQYDNYYNACYSHGMNLLIQIWKVHSLSQPKFGKLTNFPNPNSASPLTWLSVIMLLGNNYSYSCMSLVCICIYPYLVQLCTNPIQLYNFRCRRTWTLDLQVDTKTIGTWRIHLNMVGPHAFNDSFLLYSSLFIGFS